MTKDNPCPEIERAIIDDIIEAFHEKREPKDTDAIIATFPDHRVAVYRRWRADAPERESQEKELEKAAQRRRILAAARIPARFRGTRFGELDSSHCPEAFRRCLEYVHNSCTLDDSRGLILTGPPGTGKTALAVACLREVVERYCRPVRYFKLSAFLQGLREQYGDRREGQEPPSTIEEALQFDVVVFDDINRQRLTEWGATTFHDLVDDLYDQNARVIFTTNSTREQFLEAVDETTASRIDQMCAPIEVGPRNLRYPEGQ